MLAAVGRVADRLIDLSASIAAFGLVIEVGVILIDVVGRFFGRPIYGSQDLITMTMVVLVFGAMALCDRRGGNVSVDLLQRYFPAGVNHAIDVAAALLGAAIFVALAWAVWESAKLSVMLNLSTNLLTLPKAWFQWALCGFALITALGMGLRALDLMLNRRRVPEDGSP